MKFETAIWLISLISLPIIHFIQNYKPKHDAKYNQLNKTGRRQDVCFNDVVCIGGNRIYDILFSKEKIKLMETLMNHWKLITAIVLLIVFVRRERAMMKRNIEESERFIDTWWEEHSDMFVDTDGNLFLLIDKQEIFYPLEEKLF